MVDLNTAQINSALQYPSNYWSGAQITFSFPTAGAGWADYAGGSEPFVGGYGVLNAGQQATLRAELAIWGRLIAPSLVEVADPGQIRVAFTDTQTVTGSNSWGFAYSPPGNGGAGSPKAGDVWIDDSHANSSFTPGSYDFVAALHELGHSLGLKHSFEDGATLPTAYDNYRYSIMSYTPNADYLLVTVTRSDNTVQGARAGVYPTTPMLLDVAAIQSRYGADPSTFAGDTAYTFDQSRPIMQTIYDASGNDTLDLSAHTRGSIVDLTPGAYSSIAQFSAADQAAFYKAQIGGGADSYIDSLFSDSRTYTWTDNLAIATNTVIENVRGGSAADRVKGNDANNNIGGGGGNDTIQGGGGDDYLRGDDGNDSLVGGAGFDDINGNKGNDTVYGGEGNDWVVGGQDDDLIYGETGNDIVYGNMGADTLFGAAGDDTMRGGQHDDIVNGGAGNDMLWGDRGNDTLYGGLGADQFHIFSGAGVDRVMDYNFAEGDRIVIDDRTPFTLSFVGADAVISLNSGDTMILTGVSSASALGANWLL